MLKQFLNFSTTYKNLPKDVNKITMRQAGEKYIIEVHPDGLLPVQIGKYDTREAAHRVMEQLSELTNRKIIK